MDIVLVPGLWLTGSSWERVIPVLEAAGHRAHPMTLPGLGSADADRTGVTLDDHIAAVVAAIDAADNKVLLVGHSAGCAVAYGAVEARPDHVARVIYVGGFPSADGEAIAGGFTTDGADMPLPDWGAFEEADLVGVDDAVKELFLSHSAPSPASLTTDLLRLTDERRYDVLATAVCPEYTSEMLVEWMHEGHLDELRLATNLELVDLPTGHWPQFTRPEELGRIIAERAFNPMVDEHGRVHPDGDLNEAGIALAFLEYQRATLAWKASGLDADQLNTTVAASSLTLGGLLKHMAWVEDYWFSVRLHEREPVEPWKSADWKADEDWEFTSAADDAPDELRGMWQRSVERSRALTAASLAGAGFDAVAFRPNRDGTGLSLRWIVVHMIEEYARHNGHADLIREAIDGETGE